MCVCVHSFQSARCRPAEMSYSSFSLLSLLLLLLCLVYSTHGRKGNLTALQTNSTNATWSEDKLQNSDVHSKNSTVPLRMISAVHDIVFPGDDYIPVVSQRLPERVGMEKDCVHNICEVVDNYPTDYILNSLKSSGVYDHYFKDAILPIDIADRNNFDDEELTLCQTRRHMSLPKSALDTNKVKRFVVNVDGYQQTLLLETCIENSKCKFSELFPNDYEVTCKQRYAIRRLVTMGDDEKPAVDNFEVPSCCVCTYKKKDRK